MSAAATSPKPATPLKSALIAGLTGGVIAAVINTVIYFVAQSVNGGPLVVQTPQAPTPQPLPLPAVLLFSIAPELCRYREARKRRGRRRSPPGLRTSEQGCE